MTRVWINFHGIGDPPAGTPEHEARMWLPEEPFRRILDRVAGDARVQLTFDDGFVSDVEIALGELTRRDLRATFFVIADALDTPGRLCREEVRTLAAAGMRIGSHGIRHRRWRGLAPEELRHELHDSRRVLCEIAGTEVDEAACPFGAYDRGVLREARRAGYRRVFTSDGGPAPARGFVQPRTSVRRTDDADAVGRWLEPPLYVSARRRVMRRARAWR